VTEFRQPETTEEVVRCLQIIGIDEPWPEELLSSIDITSEQYCLKTRRIFAEQGGIITSFMVLCRRHPQGVHEQKCVVNVTLNPEVHPDRNVMAIVHRVTKAIVDGGQAACVVRVTEAHVLTARSALECALLSTGPSISNHPRSLEAVFLTVETPAAVQSWWARIQVSPVLVGDKPARRTLDAFVLAGEQDPQFGPAISFFPGREREAP